MSDSPPEKKESAGVPAWVMTFADLMTLLMCFFVLLLAFSEMDAAKFKQLSGSMKDAFGVQAEVEVRTIPKGTSVVAQEFSPGKPENTLVNQVRQFTIDSNRNTLDALDRELKEIKETRDHARRLRVALKEEIENGSVSIQTQGMRVIVHVMENASFDSGVAVLRPEFMPVLEKIASLIDNNSGDVTVSGHTDNIPISNSQFRSNWDLSTSRAVTVTHQLLRLAELNPEHVMVTGHADTRPRAENDSVENRAKNRRVDISIVRGQDIDEYRRMSIADSLADSFVEPIADSIVDSTPEAADQEDLIQ